ncbi:MAG: type I glyceraldehyde-3-phosphate dehydrogenase [Candidatus Uhrbacteria bacterium]|nr:type I glyceraldehyde-3-phosphate dehydrogenase [Candidatus Uhrbacteria bacterium]
MSTIAINGFGRIGRQTFKAGWGKAGFNIVAINDLTDAKTLAYLLRYDTNYGTWDVPVRSSGNTLIVDGKKIPVLSEKDPSALPWGDLGVDIVIESTGFFATEELAMMHINAGAKRVIISAPSKGGNVPTYVLGASKKDPSKEKASVINNASCTTNCAAPMVAILHEAFGVEKAMLTTVHGYTSTQKLVDSPHKDLRRGRAAAVNMIPTSTGATRATGEAYPSIKDKFDGIAIRVPIPTTSLSDVTMLLKKDVTVEKVNNAIKKACKTSRWKGIAGWTEEPLVSSDFVGNAYSAVFDLAMTRVVGGNLVKIIAWYDNEWGYANRLSELAVFAGKAFKK